MTTSQSKIGEIQKNEGEGAGQQDLSKNVIKREHWTKTVSVRFFTRIYAQPVRSPLQSTEREGLKPGGFMNPPVFLMLNEVQ
jgi:hypothetical protein